MLATPVEALAPTDIPDYALEALGQSRIRTIHIVGRRGPAQAKFTNFELKELGEIRGCRAFVDTRDLDLNQESRLELADPRAEIAARNVEIFSRFAASPGADGKLCRFRFFETPIAVKGQARVESITLAKNRLSGEPFSQVAEATRESVELDCGVIFRSIGFSGSPPAGVPFDSVRAIVPSRSGRIVDAAVPVAGLYATGWIKRGPSGVIGTNRADSAETIKSLLEDLPALRPAPRPGGVALDKLLADRGIRFVAYGDWLRLDAMEQARGRTRGKPREKFCAVGEMLDALGGDQASGP
jgi:ferredoxin--NADP+ reductase